MLNSYSAEYMYGKRTIYVHFSLLRHITISRMIEIIPRGTQNKDSLTLHMFSTTSLSVWGGQCNHAVLKLLCNPWNIEMAFVCCVLLLLFYRFVMHMQNSPTYIFSGCFTCPGATTWCHCFLWRNARGYGKIRLYITIAKHNNAQAVSCALWMYRRLTYSIMPPFK